MTKPRVFGGRYELGELIGYGGMAEVHRGRDLRLNRDVAIKVLRADLARDQSFLARFRREAHSAAGLNHPSIVSVYDTGEDPTADGTGGTELPYIVMEFVDGRTLRDILRAEGRLPARRALEITADVCAALDFSHRNGIIHRDIKPANVMITPTGAVKVMDFGIARAVADNSATVTQTANVIGTAQYLSPEQARGEAVDARSDVYSTGCLLYELLTGSPPFQGDSPVAVAYQHVREVPMLPSGRNPDVPRAVDSIVMKSLAKNVANRYQSAAEMRQDIQRALANQPVLAEAVMTDAERTQFIARTPPPPVFVPRRADDFVDEPDHARRSGLIWLAVALAVLLVAAGAGYLIYANRTSDKPAAAQVTVPVDVVGMSAQAAEDSLTRLNLVPVRAGTTTGPCFNNRTVQPDQVCTLDPAPGEQVPENTQIKYRVYKQGTVQVPDVSTRDYSYDDAAQAISAVDLKPKRVNIDNRAPEGQVVRQRPAAFTLVKPGATVTVFVSNGTVKLPDVTGLSYQAALAKLNGLGFLNVQQNEAGPTDDPNQDQKVAAMSLTPKLSYPLRTPITLSVYVYTEPTTPSSEPPSSAPSSAPSSCPPTSGPSSAPPTC
jgi:serine/threonine-protein kinase